MGETRLVPFSIAQVEALPAMPPAMPTLAQLLGIQTTAGYALIRSGNSPIPVVKVGRLYRLRKTDILSFLGLTENGDGTGAATPVPSVERTAIPTSE